MFGYIQETKTTPRWQNCCGPDVAHTLSEMMALVWPYVSQEPTE